jgi:hypothetical protein
MNIWELPPVRQAAQTILLEARFLRLEHPEMTPLERIQEARARCVPEVLAALGSIIRAEEMAKNGPWVLQGGRQRRSKRGTSSRGEHDGGRQQQAGDHNRGSMLVQTCRRQFRVRRRRASMCSRLRVDIPCRHLLTVAQDTPSCWTTISRDSPGL